MAKTTTTQSRLAYHAQFAQALAKLNVNQRRAVDTIEGPVLVVAGPGTGKTHILSARIGQILLQTDVFPHNILCLTYTDAGVYAMRERLLSWIGPASHKVHIYTFHSFCNMVIQDNMEVFGKRDLEPVSELERVEIIRVLIDSLADSHLLKSLKRDSYLYERHLKDLFERIKAENWKVATIHQKITEYLEGLPTKKGFYYQRRYKQHQKGDPKTAKIAEENRKMNYLKAAIDLFPSYENLLEQKKRYDFGDMLQWIIEAFTNQEQLLRLYQEQYLYILVDEFQDTNGTQSQILHLLTAYWNTPNIFVVGDDDQSIYEFQGARVKNIRDFYENYKGVIELVVLNENYRSSQHILNTAKILIDHNDLRLIKQLKNGQLTKNLKASNPTVAQSRITTKIVEYYNTLHEDVDIVLQIETLQRQKVPLNEIAIIYAKHRQARNIIQLLERKGLPYQTKRRINILKLPLIRNLLTLFRYIQKEFDRPHSGEKLLFEILHFDFIGIAPSDTTQLAVFMATDRAAKIKTERRDSIIRWRDVLGQTTHLQNIGLQQPTAFRRLYDLIHIILGDKMNLQMPILFERLMNRSGLLQFITHHADKVWLMQVVSTFFNFIQRETAKNPKFNIKQLLTTIQQMESNRIAMNLQKTLYAENGVNLITAHSSKGLEFKYVFIIDGVKSNWQPSRHIARNRFAYPDTLTLSGTEDAEEAARRLFYVAMTRAKEFLHISYAAKDTDGKARRKTRFIDEVITNTSIQITPQHLPKEKLVDAQILLLTEKQQPKISSTLSKDALDGLLEGFTLSATSLCRILACPLSFYYENVLHVPNTSSEAAAYGSAVHYSLRRLFERIDPENGEFPTEAQFMKDFERELERQKVHLTDNQYRRRLALGRQDLPLYYKARTPHFFKKVEVEVEIRNVEVQGIPITGTVDKVEYISNNRINVVDYKTGTFRSKKIERPSKKNPLGGDYWRQVVFYKILLENFRNAQWTVRSGAIDYIEPNRKTGQFLFKQLSITQEDVAIVTQQIISAHQRIRNHDFFEGCGKSTCHWCNFANQHIIRDSYADALTGELDD